MRQLTKFNHHNSYTSDLELLLQQSIIPFDSIPLTFLGFKLHSNTIFEFKSSFSEQYFLIPATTSLTIVESSVIATFCT